MSTQTFSKPFLFSNNKEKLKTNYFYSYWAGPWKRTGPRPQPACSARAKGRAAAWLRVRPTAILAQHRPRRDATPTPAARHHGGAAYPRAGAFRPQQATGRRAQGSRGQSSADAREKDDRVGACRLPGHELRRACRGGAEKKSATTASHLVYGSHTRAQPKSLTRRSSRREESGNEEREEEQIAGGATAALGGEARYAREELLRLAEWGVLRSDSLNAELRWRDIGEARVLAGATGRHPAGVAGMRSPRGAACLTRSGAARGWRRQRAGGLGHGDRAGPRRRRGCGVDVGPASAGGPEARRRPTKEEKAFSKYIFKEFLNAIF